MDIQIEEIRAASLANLIYNGDLGGLLKDFYSGGGGNPNSVLQGLETEWLRLMGYTTPILNDKWTAYLTSFGFTGLLCSFYW